MFPTRGKRQPWPKPRQGGGGPLLYSNYRTQIWKPFLAKLGLPEVTPHSARHAYASVLKHKGIAIADVSRLLGHASPAVTLAIYSHGSQESDAAAEALERAYAH